MEVRTVAEMTLEELGAWLVNPTFQRRCAINPDATMTIRGIDIKAPTSSTGKTPDPSTVTVVLRLGVQVPE